MGSFDVTTDDVDTLLGSCDDIEREVPVSMQAEFLSQWDGLETDTASKVIILGATNRPQNLAGFVTRR